MGGEAMSVEQKLTVHCDVRGCREKYEATKARSVSAARREAARRGKWYISRNRDVGDRCPNHAPARMP